MTIYLDMDGVLADFDEYRDRIFPGVYSGLKDAAVSHTFDVTAWEVIHRDHPTFFRDLKPMPDLKVLLDYVMPLKPVVLSALPKSDNHFYKTLTQKREWLNQHVGDIPAIFCLRSHKQDWAKSGRILIDDSATNCVEFSKKGGAVIHHKNAADTVKLLQQMGR